MSRLDRFKKLVVATAVVAVGVLVGGGIYTAFRSAPPVSIELDGQPAIGAADAPVQVVIFEDFLCHMCREFSEEIFPQLERDYIATGNVRFVMVPLGFIEGSKPLANAALEVYRIAPDRYFLFVHEMFAYLRQYNVPPALEPMILSIAAQIGKIDSYELRSSIRYQRHYPALERNYSLAKKIMGKSFGTPALYVNGIQTSPIDYKAIKKRVEKELSKRRKN
jgi:protein-disulfide isomerase